MKYQKIESMKNSESTKSTISRKILTEKYYTTLALTDGNEPYTLSLHYALDPEEDTLYFLSDKGGTKLDYFRSDPYVCGTVIAEDEAGYSSVVYRGLVEVVHKKAEQLKILDLFRLRHMPFHRIPEEHGENSMYLKLNIDEISVRSFP